ncbi:hypothetical protein HDV00_012561 [Rhizophlyctis rosea]|nr:hypothetical protein HDV00_012561 [Rhizophlyctis rosea]
MAPKCKVLLSVEEQKLVDTLRQFDNERKPKESVVVVLQYLKQHKSLSDEVKVKTAFNLPPNLKRYSPPTLPLPESTVYAIRDSLKKSLVVLGDMRSGKEQKRNYFIWEVLKEVLVLFGGSITIDVEGTLKSTVPSGNVEFVLKVLQEIVIKMVECKQDDFDQGLAQLILEMYAARTQNEVNGVRTDQVLGILTNAATWGFLSYTDNGQRGQFTRSADLPLDFSIEDAEDEKSLARVREVAETVFGMVFTQWQMALRHLDEKGRLDYGLSLSGEIPAKLERVRGVSTIDDATWEKSRRAIQRMEEVKALLETGDQKVINFAVEKLSKYGAAFTAGPDDVDLLEVLDEPAVQRES